MKIRALLFLLLAALLPLAAPRTAQAQADVSFDYFYDALQPYGEWVQVDGYGLCWRPTDVDADWTPYSDGYWAYTDAGWTWVGYEEFAGIVYHYGRWVSVEDVGWVWVPDYEWGPAWVSWRNSDDYIGWAPLPPQAAWQPEIGIGTWVDTTCDIGPGFYNFCAVRDFGAPVLRPVIIDRRRNVFIIRNTVNITNITYNTFGSSPVIFCGGPSFLVISNRCDRPIPALKLVRETHFDRRNFHGGPGGFSSNARTVGNQLVVNAPIVAPPTQPALWKDKVKKTFAAPKVNTGWAIVKDTKERDDLRQRFQRETKGLTPYTAPAHAVAAGDLQAVPVHADPVATLPGSTGRGPRGQGVRPAAPVTAGVVAATPPPATVNGVPLKPFNPPGENRPGTPAKPLATLPETNLGGNNGRPERGREKPPVPVVVPPPNPVVTAAPKAELPATPGVVPTEPRPGRGPGRGFTNNNDPAAQAAQEQQRLARQREAEAAAQQQKQAAEAAAASTEKEKMQAQQQQQRAAQVDREKFQAEQDNINRQRAAAAAATAQQQKQAAEAAAASTEKEKMQFQQQQQRAAQVEQENNLARQRAAAAQQQQLEAQRQQQLEQQRAAQQQQMEQQRAAQEAQRQQALRQQMEAQRAAQEAARQEQMEQQRAAQEAAKQQAREQQIMQQRAAQEAAQQQAAEQHRAQQAEAQRAAAAAAAAAQATPAASDDRHGGKDKGR